MQFPPLCLHVNHVPPNNKFTTLMQYSNWTHILTSTQIYRPPPTACLHACTLARNIKKKKQIGNPFQRCSASLSTSAFPCARPLSGLLSYSLSYGGRRWKGAGRRRDGGAGREEVRLRQKPGKLTGNVARSGRYVQLVSVYGRDQMYQRGHAAVTGAVRVFEEAKAGANGSIA